MIPRLLFYFKKMTVADLTSKPIKEEYEMLKSYEPMMYRGTFEDALDMYELRQRELKEMLEKGNSLSLNKIAVSDTTTLSHIKHVESDVNFVKWHQESKDFIDNNIKQ
jgi:hypothetical protein